MKGMAIAKRSRTRRQSFAFSPAQFIGVLRVRAQGFILPKGPGPQEVLKRPGIPLFILDFSENVNEIAPGFELLQPYSQPTPLGYRKQILPQDLSCCSTADVL
ncbi:hypothetical protein TNCV_2069371 [Trichonephila clavipes]|uniref:Uncharacterized protein n=1 Tax=Trichonephila clavipes TaxID=2585209 RepID=A0A8X7BEA9_TRICX|nr:hypothetical protein TNCV_2069371 [Trichonephila clavipes]